MRLVVKGWCSLDAARSMPRLAVVDACDWLDAVEEAEREAGAEAKRRR